MSAILMGRPVSLLEAQFASKVSELSKEGNIVAGRQFDARLSSRENAALASGFASTFGQGYQKPKTGRSIPVRPLLAVVMAIDKTMGARSDLRPTIFAAKEGRRTVISLLERGIK